MSTSSGAKERESARKCASRQMIVEWMNLSSEVDGLRRRLLIAARTALGRDLAQQLIDARCFFW
ncbi:MAG: hypothetical protein BroJett021_03340 [Chloroflexota bacterium]|nr:MAG: hypothetical protein BroJett021_03340 [Chloroflexota bacterium]